MCISKLKVNKGKIWLSNEMDCRDGVWGVWRKVCVEECDMLTIWPSFPFWPWFTIIDHRWLWFPNVAYGWWWLAIVEIVDWDKQWLTMKDNFGTDCYVSPWFIKVSQGWPCLTMIVHIWSCRLYLTFQIMYDHSDYV